MFKKTMIQNKSMATEKRGMAIKNRKTAEGTRSGKSRKKSVEMAIRAAKEAAERSKKGSWKPVEIWSLAALGVGLSGALIGTFLWPEIKYEYSKLQSTRQEAQHKAMPVPHAVAAPAAIKPSLKATSPTAATKDTMPLLPWWATSFQGEMPSPAAAAKDTSATMPALANMINENARYRDSLRSAEYVISNLKAQLAAAMGPEGKTAVSSPPKMAAAPDTEKCDSANVSEPAVPAGADSADTMVAFSKVPASVQDYMEYRADSANGGKIRINLSRIMGGDDRYLEIRLDSQPIWITGSGEGGNRSCTIRLDGKAFKIDMEKKGGVFGKKFVNIIIREIETPTNNKRTAWLTVDRKGAVGGNRKSLDNLEVRAINVCGTQEDASW
jgi:cytoskeletal protein RodZ